MPVDLQKVLTALIGEIDSTLPEGTRRAALTTAAWVEEWCKGLPEEEAVLILAIVLKRLLERKI